MKHEATGGPSHVRTEKELQWLIFSMKSVKGSEWNPDVFSRIQHNDPWPNWIRSGGNSMKD